LATIAITGAAVLATGMYAATDSTNTNGTMQMKHMKANPQDMITSLSGKVSAEALTALQTLMAKHKTEMETMHSNSGNTIDRIEMDAKRTAFKTEMDALMMQYPELKTAMPTMEK
jgi:hypothetical protein